MFIEVLKKLMEPDSVFVETWKAVAADALICYANRLSISAMIDGRKKFWK